MLVPHLEIIIDLDGVELSRVEVASGGYVIGSDPAADITASADGVARYHAHITVTAGELWIKDLGSETGTYIAGKLATESVRIWPNQKVLIGPAVLEARRLRQSSSGATLPASVAVARRILPEEFLRERKYEIEGTLGQGGMGAVLSAREATTRRTVAMKVMLSSISEADVIRFISEAQITSQLEHPNIVPVHELGVNEHDQVFYTMKHVQGMNLRTVLRQLSRGDKPACEAYPLRRLLEILLRVCDGLAFAHSRRIIHRDLKPDNIMLGDFGEVLVMDWGLAKAISSRPPVIPSPQTSETDPTVNISSVRNQEEESLTVVGAFVGTPRYMSPEQARGESESLDERTDIWALGAILRHILSLAKPVPGDTADDIMANVRAHRLTPIPPEAPHCPGGRVPESLIAVAEKAQALAPGDRYRSVGEFRDDIDAYLGGFATTAEKASALRQFWLLTKRHRTVSAALLVLMAVTVTFIFQLMASEKKSDENAQNARRSEAIAQRNELNARAAEAVAVRQREIGNQALAASQIALADAVYRQADSMQLNSALDSVDEKLRNPEWRYLKARSDNSINTVSSRPGEWYIASAPHPKRPGIFALSSNMGNVVLADISTGRVIFEFQISVAQRKANYYRGLAFSPDGEWIAVGTMSSGGVEVYSVKDGKSHHVFEGNGVNNLCFSPDGKLLMTVDGNLQLVVRDFARGEVVTSYGPTNRACFTPDGKIVSVYGKTIRIVNAQTGVMERAVYQSASFVTWLTLSTDGGTAYIATADGRVQGVDMATGLPTFHGIVTPRGGSIRLWVSNDYVAGATSPGDRARAVVVWDIRNGAQLPPLLGGGSSDVEGLSIHPLSGDILVTGVESRAWNISYRKPTWTVPATRDANIFMEKDDWYFPGNTFVTLKKGGEIQPHPWAYSKETSDCDLAHARGNTLVLASSILRPTGSKIFAFERQGEKTRLLRTFVTHSQLSRVRVSPDGEHVVDLNFYAGAVVRNIRTGETLPRIRTDGLQEIYDIQWLGPHHLVGNGATGTRGAIGTSYCLALWDVRTGEIIRRERMNTMSTAIAVAPDQKTFAEGGADQTVHIRDAATLALKVEFRAHDSPITAITYHPTKPILATCSADLMIRQWNLEDQSMIEEIRTPGKEPGSLQYSPSGNYLAVADFFSQSLVWDISQPFAKLRETPQRPPVEEAAVHRKSAQTAGRGGKWSRALFDYQQAIRLEPENPLNWFPAAPLFVRLNDVVGYQQYCQALIAQFGGTEDPSLQERVGKAISLLPTTPDLQAKAIHLTQKAIQHRSHPMYNWFRMAAGLALYRHGDYMAAEETLQPALAKEPVLAGDYDTRFLLAMAKFKRESIEEAKALLAETRAATVKAIPSEEIEDQTDAWHDYLTNRLLEKEACATILGEK